jgi:hypothetical protein
VSSGSTIFHKIAHAAISPVPQCPLSLSRVSTGSLFAATRAAWFG